MSARDKNGIIHGHERYRVGEGEYDDLTWCGVTIATIEFFDPALRKFKWSFQPVNCIACWGSRVLCSSE